MVTEVGAALAGITSLTESVPPGRVGTPRLATPSESATKPRTRARQKRGLKKADVRLACLRIRFPSCFGLLWPRNRSRAGLAGHPFPLQIAAKKFQEICGHCAGRHSGI